MERLMLSMHMATMIMDIIESGGIMHIASAANEWNTLGNITIRALSGDQFGQSVLISADGKTIASGTAHNDVSDKVAMLEYLLILYHKEMEFSRK